MPATLLGRRLTEAHRLAQARLGASTVVQLDPLWQLLDPVDLDRTVATWLRAVVPVVQRQNELSARLAANYYSAFRQVELGAPIQVLPQLTAGTERVVTSMTVTGPVRIKSAAARGVQLARAAETAFTTSAGAAQRLALDGGRSTIQYNLANDNDAVGWERVTSGNSCDFCAAIADRGVVFKEDTADFAAHDNCSCASQPVFATGKRGDSARVGGFVARDLSEAQRADANERIRAWLADA